MVLGILALLLTGAQSAPRAPAPPQSKPKLICHEGESRLGTHMRTGRECKTAEEWQKENAHRDAMPPSLLVTPDPGDGIHPTQSPQ